jgi:ectoine hydroxylase-related dioxygenase (phytanoyl-CoA dioxygenase family)
MAYDEQIKISRSDIRQSLEEDGYATISNFLSQEQITKAEDFFYSTYSESCLDVPFFTTHWSENKNYRLAINKFLQSMLVPLTNQYVQTYKPLLGYYLYKKPSANNLVYMHQDWSLVDENLYTGYIVWIPLVDTNENNGCFKLVKGSHKQFINPRGSGISQQYNEIKEENFTAIPLQKGSAVIFNQRLLHSSPPNLSGSDRLAVGLIIVPEKAPVVHYSFDNNNGKIRMQQMPDTFLLDYYYDYKNSNSSLICQIQNTNYERNV